MSFYTPLNGSTSWDGYTFILPAVSVGNVGQLAVDLVISTLQMKKAGLIHDDSITPVIGSDPYKGCFSSRVGTLQLKPEDATSNPAPSLMTSCELYESTSHRLVVMQLRSPLIRGRKTSFLRRLVDFIKEMRFSQTMILSSSHAHERIDTQLRGDQFRFLSSSSFLEAPLSEVLSTLGWTRLETRENRDDYGKDVNPYMPGGGLAKQMFQLCQKESVPVSVLLVFCSEGDNVPEAFLLANRLNDLAKLLDGQRPNWRIPSSWSALFGNPAAENELVFG